MRRGLGAGGWGLLALLAPAALRAETAVTAPPLDPVPVTVPLRPDDGPRGDDPEARLRRRLADAIAERDRRIAELARSRDGRAPVAAPEVAGLDDARRARDEALAAARAGAQQLVAKTRATRGDVLDVAAPVQMQEQGDALGAGNRLAIADCYRRIVAEQAGTPEDLATGQAALDQVDAAKLPAADLPRLLYLRVWYLAERARRSADADERERLVAAAREVQRDLLRDHPQSELARTAQKLVLDLAPTAPAP